MTQSEMAEMSGQTGIVMSSIGDISVRAQFETISFGDSDGWGANGGVNHNAGWLVLIGTGTNYGYLTITVPSQTTFSADVGTVVGCTFHPEGYNGISIPIGSSFFSFSLTDTDITLYNPDTINIMLSNLSGSSASLANMDRAGWIKPDGVSIILDPQGGAVSKCFIWAH